MARSSPTSPTRTALVVGTASRSTPSSGAAMTMSRPLEARSVRPGGVAAASTNLSRRSASKRRSGSSGNEVRRSVTPLTRPLPGTRVLGSSRDMAREGLANRFDAPARRSARRTSQAMRSGSAPSLSTRIGASGASVSGGSGRLGRAAQAPSESRGTGRRGGYVSTVRRSASTHTAAMMPGVTRRSVLESSRSALHPTEARRSGVAGPSSQPAPNQRPEVRRALATVAGPSMVAIGSAATGSGSKSGPLAHPGMPLRRAAVDPRTDTRTARPAREPGRMRPDSVDGGQVPSARNGRRDSPAARTAQRIQRSMAAGSVAPSVTASRVGSQSGPTGDDIRSMSGSRASFRSSRPRPGGAIGQVRRREVPAMNRPVGWSAALAGVQAGRREQSEPTVASRSTAGSSTARGSSMASTPANSVRRSVVRRSSGSSGSASVVRRSSSPPPAPGGTWSAADLASRLERGESVPTEIERTVRRSMDTSSGQTSTIRRQAGLEEGRESPSDSATPASLIGGNSMSTSRMLDIQAWIADMVEERLALELERRGLSGDRW